MKIVVNIFIVIFTTIIIQGFNLSLQLTLTHLDLYSDYLFLGLPVLAVSAFYLGSFLIWKFKSIEGVTNRTSFLKNTDPNSSQTSGDKLKGAICVVILILNFFLSVPILLISIDYYKSYQMEKYGTNGILILEKKESYMNHGEKFFVIGKLKFENNQIENAQLETTKEKFPKFSIGDSVPVFFSRKDFKLIQEKKSE